MTTIKRQVPEVLQLENALGLELDSAPFSEIASRVSGLSDRESQALLLLCENTLSSRRKREQEAVRVSAVKVLVALAPRSENQIKHWLQKNSEASFYEVHFSLFCFLDQVPSLKGAKTFASQIPTLVADYLDKVKAETAQAAWMAGDLLGDHWETETALPVLITAAEKGRFAAGRLGALHGIEHILVRLNGSRRESVLRLLRAVWRVDKSTKVRNFAKFLLDRKDVHHVT